MKKLLLFVALLPLTLWGQSATFYGSPIALTGDPNVNAPSDYTTPIQPSIGNGVSVNGHRAGNAKLDTSWGTPVWKVVDFGVIGTSWAWSVPVDDLHRWGFITTTGANTSGYNSKLVVNLWDGTLACSVGYMQQGGPGHRNIVRDPKTGTGYVVNSVLTVSTGSFPVDKSMTGTDITINGVVYQIASDNGSIVLAQAGVNVGSVGSPVAFSGGWNDQDVAYGLYPPSQIARVNIRVCNAVAPSKVTSPTDPSWETYDTINGGTGYVGTNLYWNGYLAGGSSDISDDGNTFVISDNTNNTGNAYDPRLYTLVSKNAGTWTSAVPRYAWNTLTALNCASSATTCTITTTGSPGYPLGAALQIENANITGSGGASSARGLKYMTCYVSVVTDANNYTVNGCPAQGSTVTETSGYVNEQLRSAMTVEQADNFPTIGAGVGKTYMQGTENNTHNGGGNSLYIWDVSGTPTMVKLLTNDAGHITRYAYNGDLWLTQYAGKTVNTASGDQTMAGCSGSIFTWNSRTDAMSCLFPNVGMDLSEEYYSSSTPARRSLAHPYIIISQLDDYPLTSYTSMASYTYATRPITNVFFKLTDSQVAGDCNIGGGGTQLAFCGLNAGLAAYVPVNTYSIPLMTGTVTVSGTPRNFDWTQRWGYYITGSSWNGGQRFITNELFFYDLAAAQGYHLLHHYTRAIAPAYLNSNDFNVLPHVASSRDGSIVCFDSSYGSAQDVSGYCAQVLKDAVTTVTVSPSSASIPTLGTQQFTSSPTGAAWMVSSGCAGTISSVGIFTATATPETCAVTATLGSAGTATINVVALAVTPSTAALNVGATQQFTSNFPSTWSATGGTISSSGLYTAPSMNGTYTITATATNGGATATATVTVTGQLTTIPLSISPLSWTQQTTISTTITKTFTATNIGTGAVTPTVTLTGSAKFSISANTCTGAVSGGGNCTVTIQFLSSVVGAFSATLNISDTAGGNQNLPLSVSIPSGTVVTISPTSVTVPINGTQQFSASTSNGSGVTWATTCSGGSISAGFFTAGGSAAICTVTATTTDGSGANASASVTIVTVAVNPSAVTMQILSTQQFSANVSITWAASCGTITNAGKYTAPGSPASCTITATATNGGATGIATATVVNPPASSQGGKNNGKGNPHKFS